MTLQFKAGEFVLNDGDRQQIDEMLRATAASNDPEKHTAMAAAIVAPISAVAAYEECFGDVFMVDSIDLNEDSRVPLETYEVQAHYVSADGQAMPVRLGWIYTDMEFFRIEASFEIHMDDLARATWPILADKIKRAGEEMARKRDNKRRLALAAAAAAVAGHTPTSTGGGLDKDAVDAVFAAIARVGFHTDRVKVNSADVLAMRGWSGAVFQEVEGIAGILIRRGYLGDYGGAIWQANYTIPGYVAGTQNGKVYFLGPPNTVGYERHKGQLRGMSEVDARRKVNAYFYDQSLGILVANNYSVWELSITA